MTLTWRSGRELARCIPCDAEREAESLFSSQTAIGTPLQGTLCTVCASVTVLGGEMQSEPDDQFVDHYLQSEAGIDTILQNLYRVDNGAGTSFLDVGANYGFATRYARDVLGWDALGVEPSYSGRRGGRELNVEILDQYVTAETTLGRTFDVILASEVIEHVPDPRAFLHGMRVHLAPGGVLLMTTPAAEIVRPATEHWALQAVGPGGHLYLASAEALRMLLADSGFASATVHRDGPTLYIAAAVEAGRELPITSSGPSQAEVAQFLEAIETDAASPDQLRAAMAVRRFRTLVNMGHDAESVESSMIEIVQSVHGVDLSDPLGTARRIARGDELPILVGPAAFACGMRRVVHRHDWHDAVAYFALAEAAVDDKRRRFHVFDGDSRIIEASSRAHRALSLLHTDPRAGVALWASLWGAGELVDPAQWTVQLFVEAASVDQLDLFDDHLQAVADAVAALCSSHDASHAVAAINAGYLLATRAVARGDRWCATQWVSLCETLLSSPHTTVDATWASAIGGSLREVRGTLVELRPEAIPSTVPMPRPEHERLVWDLTDETAEAGAISVVLALYNGSRYVVEAVKSVGAQSTLPLELIIVDDGGHDDSVALVSALALPFDVRVVKQLNAGQSAARNAGIRVARGEFIAFIDQDDAWRPSHLAGLLAQLRDEPETAWVFSDFDLVDGNGETMVRDYVAQTVPTLQRNTVAELLDHDLMALPSASLMRRDALREVGGFDRRFSGYEDDDLYVRLFRSGWRVTPLARSTVRYRTHDANASSSVAYLRSRLVFIDTLLQHAKGSEYAPPSLIVHRIMPRVLQSTMHDYTVAIESGDDELARTIAWVLERLTMMRPTGIVRARRGIRILANPPLTRRLLRASMHAPAWLRRRMIPKLLLPYVPRITGSREAPPSIDLDLGDWTTRLQHVPKR